MRTAADNKPAVEGEGVFGPFSGDDPFLTVVCKLGSVTIGGRVKVLPKGRVDEGPYAVEEGFLYCFFSGVVLSAPRRKVVEPDSDMRRVVEDALLWVECVLAALDAVDFDHRFTFEFPVPWFIPVRLVERRCAYVVVAARVGSGAVATGFCRDAFWGTVACDGTV